MPLLGENHFKCDFKDVNGPCDVDFYYDPGRQGAPPPVWDAGTQARLNKIVAVVYPLTNHTTFYCCDEHAIQAIKTGQHLPPLPQKIAAEGSDAAVKAAAAGARAVAQMKSPGAKLS
jgi:hypothetical protein